MPDDPKTEKPEDSTPPFVGQPVSTPDFVQAMRDIITVHEAARKRERHDANSAQQHAIGIISKEQLFLASRMTDLAETQRAQETKLGNMDAKIDTVISLAKSNGVTATEAAIKSEAAAKTSGKTFVEQRAAIITALGTVAYFVFEYLTKK